MSNPDKCPRCFAPLDVYEDPFEPNADLVASCHECGALPGQLHADKCATPDDERYQQQREMQDTARVSRSSCRECGTDLEKHDYAFFRIGQLRSEIEIAINLLRRDVTPTLVARELERALFATRFDYPAQRRPTSEALPRT